MEFLDGSISLSVILKFSLVGMFARMGILQLEHSEEKSCKEWMVSMERVGNIGGDVRRFAGLIIWELKFVVLNWPLWLKGWTVGSGLT